MRSLLQKFGLSRCWEVGIIQSDIKQLAKLHEGLAKINESSSVHRVYHSALEVLEDTLDFDFCAMEIQEGKEEDLLLVKCPPPSFSSNGFEACKAIRDLAEETRTREKVIWSEDAVAASGAEELAERDISYVSAPLCDIGSLQVFSSQPGSFNSTDVDLVAILAHHLYERITRSRLEGDLRDKAIHDQLTGLYNRHYLDELLAKEVERAQRYEHTLGFLMVDINGFKKVNDRYSHTTGDQVLVEIGKILQENVREPDTVVRYGGDEFLVLLPETKEGSNALSQRLKGEVRRWSEDTELIGFPLSVAVGEAKYSPGQDGEKSVEGVIKEADRKMYEDKRSQTSKL